jgi:hypothetical protein
MRAPPSVDAILETVNFPTIGVKEELAIPLTLPTPLASVWHCVAVAVAQPHCGFVHERDGIATGFCVGARDRLSEAGRSNGTKPATVEPRHRGRLSDAVAQHALADTWYRVCRPPLEHASAPR